MHWIERHYETPDPEDTTSFGQLVLALENSNGGTVSYEGTTLDVGGAIGDIKYQMDDYETSSIVNTTWINLGYNASIPEYVKYRKSVKGGYKRIWIPSMKSDTLAQIDVGDQCYTRKFDSENLSYKYNKIDDEIVKSIGTEIFTYGNNCPYSVPKSITTSNGTYEFCGYNITLNSKYNLYDTTIFRDAIVSDGRDPEEICSPYFMFDINNIGRYSTSTLRSFLNSSDKGYIYRAGDVSLENEENVEVNSMVKRVSSTKGFMENISNTVNRMWVSGTDTDQFECVSDKFWILGNGNLNLSNDYGDTHCQGMKFDTSKFSYFSSIYKIVRYNMNKYGTNSGTSDWYWLNSATSEGTDKAVEIGGGDEMYYGFMDSIDANIGLNEVNPVCVIG